MNESPPPAIADAPPGPVVLEGVAKRDLTEPLLAPLTSRPCLAYVVAAGAHGSVHDEAAQDFRLEDATGSVLVVVGKPLLALGALQIGAAIAALDADIHEVSADLSAIKVRAAKAKPTERRELNRELRALRGLYTLLCAVRAHSNGKCHVGKSLEGQARFIEQQSLRFADDRRVLRTRHLMRHETILAEGDRVTVEGELVIEAAVASSGVGYRERATARVVRGTRGQRLRVIVAGAADAELELERQRRRLDQPKVRLSKSAVAVLWSVAIASGVLAAFYLLRP